MQDNRNAYSDYDWSQNNDQLNRPYEARQFSRSQKIAVAVLAFFAFGILYLWTIQFNHGLKMAQSTEMADADAGSADSEATCKDGNCAQANQEALKKKDTDKDGLSDYDELNIYGTSPYLEDSDSDGLGDFGEVKSGKNPNCPEGQSCGEISGSANDTGDKTKDVNKLSDQISSGSIVPNQNPMGSGLSSPVSASQTQTQTQASSNSQNGAGPSGAANSQSAPATQASQVSLSQIDSAQKILNGQGDAAGLRQMLLSSGMNADDLNQISDEELMKTYNEILAGQQ